MKDFTELPKLALNSREVQILLLLKSFYQNEEDVEMLSASDIKDFLSGRTSVSYISRVLNKLEKLGLVESKSETAELTKIKYYALTEHGAEVAKALDQLISQIVNINKMILKKARFKVIKSGTRYRVSLE